MPGLANRIAARFAAPHRADLPAHGRRLRPPSASVLTGNPLRPELAGGSREAGCRLLGFDPPLPVVYVTGGSQGSHKLNRTVGGGAGAAAASAPRSSISAATTPTTGRPRLARGRRGAAARRAQRAATPSGPMSAPSSGTSTRRRSSSSGRSGAGTVNECCQLGRAGALRPAARAPAATSRRPTRGWSRRRAAPCSCRRSRSRRSGSWRP